jgi:hypothetical protein
MEMSLYIEFGNVCMLNIHVFVKVFFVNHQRNPTNQQNSTIFVTYFDAIFNIKQIVLPRSIHFYEMIVS